MKNNKLKECLLCVIPNLNLAFEIQDFATHSRYSDTEISDFRYKKNSFKNGPKYHQEKIDLARKEGILLIEIWEDEILEGDFKTIVKNSLKMKGYNV